MNIEPLEIIQTDLQRTAIELENISRYLAGHARYLQHSVHAKDAVDVNHQIQKLQTTADDLRSVAARLNR